MATADFEQVKNLVAKYGDKNTIARMASMGMIEPTTAVLAGMMIDRITQQNMAGNAPNTTVAQDVLQGQPPQPPMPQQGTAPAPQAAPQMPPQMPPQAPPQMPAMREGGVAALPVSDNMFEYQGGGIVAFAGGGSSNFSERLRPYEEK
jgi:hypothetical protein